MVKLSAKYNGNLRCKATHIPSKHTLLTDAPVDVGGKGETFSPTDLIACALITCVATTMGLYAERKRLDLKGIELEVEKKMSDSPTRKIVELPVTISIMGSFTEEQKAALEKVAHSCPVHKSLHPDIKIEMSFHWNES